MQINKFGMLWMIYDWKCLQNYRKIGLFKWCVGDGIDFHDNIIIYSMTGITSVFRSIDYAVYKSIWYYWYYIIIWVCPVIIQVY